MDTSIMRVKDHATSPSRRRRRKNVEPSFEKINAVAQTKNNVSLPPVFVKVIDYNFVPRNVKIMRGQRLVFQVVKNSRKIEEERGQTTKPAQHQITFLNVGAGGNGFRKRRNKAGKPPLKNSPVLSKGQQYEVTFADLGKYEYFCSQFVFMTGNVEVVPVSVKKNSPRGTTIVKKELESMSPEEEFDSNEESKEDIGFIEESELLHLRRKTKSKEIRVDVQLKKKKNHRNRSKTKVVRQKEHPKVATENMHKESPKSRKKFNERETRTVDARTGSKIILNEKAHMNATKDTASDGKTSSRSRQIQYPMSKVKATKAEPAKNDGQDLRLKSKPRSRKSRDTESKQDRENQSLKRTKESLKKTKGSSKRDTGKDKDTKKSLLCTKSANKVSQSKKLLSQDQTRKTKRICTSSDSREQKRATRNKQKNSRGQNANVETVRAKALPQTSSPNSSALLVPKFDARAARKFLSKGWINASVYL
mmetsp:Transcript_4633/g.5729  ORF Transcript_4633/g.5729 Transcript_4633/m.5729 type:complete len:477 (+) Transcript_4633:202-1632(+)